MAIGPKLSFIRTVVPCTYVRVSGSETHITRKNLPFKSNLMKTCLMIYSFKMVGVRASS